MSHARNDCSRRIRSRTLILIAVCLSLSACTQLGPDLMKAGRNDYNIAIQQTENEELLLNIVRLRYGDRPLYMDVGNVSTQFEWSQGASASASASSPTDDQVGIGASLLYSERPTITYTPMGGADFVRGVLTPVNLDTFVLLANAGWSIERLLRLSVDRINSVDNAPSAAGPTPRMAPKHAEFLRAARLMRTLQKRGVLEIGYHRHQQEQQVPTLYIEPEALDWSETRELYEIFGLARGRNLFKLHTSGNSIHADYLGLDTRSLMEMVFFLSHGVEVPEKDREIGHVTVTTEADGQPFDWSLVVGGLLDIRSSAEQPTNAQTAIWYRGSWFYLDDSDMTSKYTILLLEQLATLLGGTVEKVGPVLTLPIGGG